VLFDFDGQFFVKKAFIVSLRWVFESAGSDVDCFFFFFFFFSSSMERVPFDVLCYLLTLLPRSWSATEFLELRLVSKVFLRAADSFVVSTRWRESCAAYLQWSGRTFRFMPNLQACNDLAALMSDVRSSMNAKDEDCTVCYASLAWLHYGSVLSVANMGNRPLSLSPIIDFQSRRVDPPQFHSPDGWSHNGSDSEYVMSESADEKDEDLELELDADLVPTTTDAMFGWDYDMEMRHYAAADEEEMPSSWNFLHWAASRLHNIKEEAEFENVSHVYTDLAREFEESLKDQDMLNEVFSGGPVGCSCF
jgi:hypothetical protein